MNKLTDEQLNKYVDGELDSSELDEVNSELQKNEGSLAHLKSLRVVHESLKLMETNHAPDGFTERLMNLIASKTKAVKHKVSYFFISVIGLLSVGIIAVVSSVMITRPVDTGISVSSQLINNAKVAADKNLVLLQKFFSDSNVVLVMSILSLILLFGAYFSADAHKNFKNKLNNISH